MNRIKINYLINDNTLEMQFKKTFEEIFHVNCPSCSLYQKTWRPPVDIFETPHDIVVIVDLAGTRSENIHVELNTRNLRIYGTRQERHLGTHPRYHLAEISYGSFERTLPLPCAVDKETVHATYREGLLKIRATKLSLDRAHKIRITQNE
ncbi:MAG TPA: Hsp20/alpha crystallin family protein [Syntrophales bacterium]|nr:Hsp20/alpha crystallin family protein [Syntrophales bacterium]HPX55342.1 Hsp20/alpha crystallin family protein [Syntrophales bacterium]HQA81749.1 Hsp20/alpha crystallin family protein [Syntrophales bacterium]